MLTVDAALSRLTDALAAAKGAGADAADAVYVGDASTSVSVRLGVLEDIGRSEGEEIGLRVFVGTRSASVSTSDLSPAAITAVVGRAVAMAREAPADDFAGLAPADRLMTGAAFDLDLDDGGDPAGDTLKALAIAAEDAARAVPGITNSEGGGASAGRAVIALATSGGFARGYRGTSYGVSASVIAGTGQAMQRDYAYHTARHFADLDAADAIGRRASARRRGSIRPSSERRRCRSSSIPVSAARCSVISSARLPAARLRAGPASCATPSTPKCSAAGSRFATSPTATEACAPARSMARGCRQRRARSSTPGG